MVKGGSSLWRNSFRLNSLGWIGFGAGFSAVLTVAGFRVIGEIAGAEAFGRASLLYGLGLLASGIVAGPVSQALTRFYFDFDIGSDRNRLWSAGLALTALGATATIVVLCLVDVSGILEPALSLASLLALALGLVSEMLTTLSRGWLNAQSRFSMLATSQVLQSLLRPVVAYSLVSLTPDHTSLVLYAYSIPACIAAGVLLCAIATSNSLVKPDERSTTKILRFGYPLMGNAIFGWLGNAGDRYLVAGAISVEVAGVYIVASALGGRLSLMLGDVTETYYRPRVYEAVSNGDFPLVYQTCFAWARWVLFFGALILAFLVLGMPHIVRYLLASEFRSGAPTVIVASYIASWIVILSYIPQRLNYALGRTWFVTLVELGGVVAMGGFVSTLGVAYGLAGAVIGLVLAAIVRFCLAAIFARLAFRFSERSL